jgi:CheY-like chemotaxis protein
MLRRVLREDISLELRQHPALGRVLADPGQLSQVLMNLVVNARDAMPDGGLLTIETLPLRVDHANDHQFLDLAPGDYAVVAVTDTGQGIDKETQTRIFEPFFTTKEKGKGTGLGLSTVYGIVKQSGGAVLLESEPGRGAVFRVCLPVAQDDPVRASAPQPAAKAPGSGESVLVVEDEPALRGITRRMLTRLGYTVLTADCGAQALQLLDTHPDPVDLVLTDVVMPDMNGVRLVQQIHARFPDIKILYMSGYTDDAIARHGVLEPGINFICKPFGPAELAARIREVLDAAPPRPAPQ